MKTLLVICASIFALNTNALAPRESGMGFKDTTKESGMGFKDTTKESGMGFKDPRNFDDSGMGFKDTNNKEK